MTESPEPRTLAQFGVIGLAVMGRNLALNISDHGIPIAVWNRDTSLMLQLVNDNQGRDIIGARTLEEFVNSLERPRRILIMIKAGEAVDQIITNLLPYLDPEDILMDGGNSWFKDTQRREAELAEAGIYYFGVGISGGEMGARLGPSIMPGGDKEAYPLIQPVLEAIAAKTDSGPCVTYIGPDGAGHFVKMVHNGIEYGDMQLIAEAYDFLKRALDVDATELSDIFAEWNQGILQSYLIEITAQIFSKVDSESGQPLINLVLDKAGQKGTGKWTVQTALDLDVAVPTITAALDARLLSSMKAERIQASREFTGPVINASKSDKEFWIQAVHDALYASKVCAYAQGMHMIQVASIEYKWNCNFREITRIWKGGCIIRAKLLDEIMKAFDTDDQITNLLRAKSFKNQIAAFQQSWRTVVSAAFSLGIPLPAMSASLSYFDSYRTEQLPQNLTQAQRDAFGSHTYERIDHPEWGFVHSEWLE